MPWFIDSRDGEHCVLAGTREQPGEQMKCYADRNAAVQYLRALYANMPEGEKERLKDVDLSEFYSYKAKDGRDRWLTISTASVLDRENEVYTTEAIDWGNQWIKETGNYPELRIFHVRGLKAGKADSMQRIGPLAVDEGYYFDNVLGKEAQRVVGSQRMYVSRGFTLVEAVGGCPTCGTRLRVGPTGLKYGFKCPACATVALGRSLGDLHITKAIPFDLTITDRPAVLSTIVQNKERKTMTRDELKARLKEVGFGDAALAIVDALPEEDLKRMKEEDCADQFKQYIESALPEKEKEDNTDGEPQAVTMGEDGMIKCYKCGASMRLDRTKETPLPATDLEVGEEFLKELSGAVSKDVAAALLGTEMELDIPGLDGKFKSLEEALTAIKDVVDVLLKSDEERIKEIDKELSPSTKARLRLDFRTKNTPSEKLKEKPTPGVPTTAEFPIVDQKGEVLATSVSGFMGVGNEED